MNTTYSKLLAVVVSMAAVSLLFSACKKENGGGALPAFIPTEPVPEAIDLGLPSGTLWSSFNLGASAYAGHGKYYAWGETTANKEDFSWEKYIFTAEGTTTDNVKLSKYVTEDKYGSVDPDGKKSLDPQDDAASVCLGGYWQTPTTAQMSELGDNCNLQIVTLQGVKGVLFTSTIAGYTNQSIFIPFDGRRLDVRTFGKDTEFNLWTKDLNSTCYAYDNYFSEYSSIFVRGSFERYNGYSIRPVWFVPLKSISLGETASVELGKTLQLSVTKTPENASCRSFTWKSKDNNIATVDEKGLVKALKIGTVDIQVDSKEGISAICKVSVIPDVPVPDAVDMGLTSGVKWASFDLGVDDPLKNGSYYAWGETRTKDDYSWNKYVYWVSGTLSSNFVFSKYVTQIGHGTVDNLSSLQSADDPACVHLGGKWRTPSHQDIIDLIPNCDIVWEKNEGVGVKVTFTSKLNGNSIVFAAFGGYKNGNTLEHDEYSCYWSKDMYDTYNEQAYVLKLDFESETAYSNSRYHRNCGLLIRPVLDK